MLRSIVHTSANRLRETLQRKPWLLLGPLLAMAVALPIAAHTLPVPAAEGQSFYVVAHVLGSVGVLTGLALWRPRPRLVWGLLAAGVLTDTIAGVYISIPMLQGHTPPASPHIGDLFFLADYPLWTLALLLLLARREPLREAVLELSMLGLAIAMPAGVLLAAPYFMKTDMSAPEVLQALYAAADVPLLAVAVLLLLSPGARNASVRLAGLGALAYVSSDVMWNSFVLDGVGIGSNEWFDTGWLIAHGCFAAALLHPSMREAAASAPASSQRLRVWKAVLVGASPLIGTLLLGIQHRISGFRLDEHMSVTAFVLTASVVMAALATGRFWVMMRSHVETRAEALVDPLTGLLNRKALSARIAELRHQTELTGAPVGVVVGDIDHFKRINDTFGHPFGDAVLEDVAEALRDATRSLDMVYRIGGEEFVLLLPNGDLDDAAAIAERLREAVKSRVSVHDEPVTMSFGYSASDPGATFHFDSLFAEADAALYDAKRAGRDCVRPLPVQTVSPVDRRAADRSAAAV